ncbi:LEM domain-containing protein 2 [Discoglossus pictus]
MSFGKEYGSYVKQQLHAMSDDRLRWELEALGFKPGPITDSTRGVLKKKLQRLRLESTVKRSSNGDHSNRSGWTSRSHEAERRRASSSPYVAARYDDDDDEEDDYDDDEVEDDDDSVTVERAPHRHSWSTSAYSTSRGHDGRDRLGLESRRSLGANVQTSPTGQAYPREGAWRRGVSLGGEGLGRATAEPYRTTVGYTGRLTEENGDFRQSWPINRAQPRSSYLHEHREDDYHIPSTGYQRSHVPSSKDNTQWVQPKSWCKSLEYYLARLLWGLSVLLFLVFIGIITAKSGILNTQQETSLKLLPSVCEGRQDEYCKAEQKKITFQMLSELYDYLSFEAGRFECGNPDGRSSKCVPISAARDHVTNVTGYGSEKFDAALDWVLNSEKHMGIWIRGEEDPTGTVTKIDEAFCVESSRPLLGIGCRVKNAFCVALSNVFLAVLGILVLWFFVVILRYQWRKLEEEEKQVYEMVEKIIDAVRCHYKDWMLGREAYPYVGIVHVRDTLIPPQDRKRLRNVWERSVRFLGENESRLRSESQRISGEDLMVWRWTQASSDHSGGRLSSTLLSAGQ